MFCHLIFDDQPGADSQNQGAKAGGRNGNPMGGRRVLRFFVSLACGTLPSIEVASVINWNASKSKWVGDPD